MKLTGAFSTLLVVVPFLVLEVSAAPSAALAARRGGGGTQGARAKGGKQGKTGGKGAAGVGKGAAGAGNNSTGAAGAGAGGAAGNNSTAGAAGAGGNAQTSLTLDPSVIGPNLAQNGLQGNTTEAGQAASLTSTNNFINFCVGKTITDGLQVQAGSCNPVPMGNIPAKANQPTAKFQFPTNLANVAENTAFTVKMQIQGMQTGAFVNPETNYFGAPQDLNAQGQIIGHSHVVIQSMTGITDTTPLDPTVFAFFQGLNAPAANGVLTSNVKKGLPAGTYRLFSINTAANHQPVIGPVAQHGAFDDAVYFTVGNAAAQAAQAALGGAATNNTAAGAAGAGAAAGAAGAAGAAAAKGAGAAGAAAAKGAGTAGAAGAAAAKGAGAAGAAGAAATKGGNAAAKAAAAAKSVKTKGRRSFTIARQ